MGVQGAGNGAGIFQLGGVWGGDILPWAAPYAGRCVECSISWVPSTAVPGDAFQEEQPEHQGKTQLGRIDSRLMVFLAMCCNH